jgi:hypothetical protein
MEDPPYVDDHDVLVSAPRDRVWTALESYVDEVLATGRATLLTRLLGTSPASGFGVASRVAPQRIELTGRHHFSRYRLVFSLLDASEAATTLRATTYAAFSGPHGAAYRLMVIGSRAHVLATRRMLASVAARATGSH